MNKQTLVPIIIIVGVVLFISNNSCTDKKTQPIAINNHIPSRIVSINPGATEIIFAMGVEEKLVAVSDYCSYPPETEKVDKVGGVVNPNFEHIHKLKPDLVIVQGKCKAITDYCDKNQIEYINIHLRTLSQIYENINELGEKLGCEAEANTLCAKIKNDLEGIKCMVHDVEARKVFFSLYRTPGELSGITTIGPETCLNELIEIAGGQNIFNDLQQAYSVISKETLLKRQPDVVIESRSGGGLPDNGNVVKDWDNLSKLTAVFNGHVKIVDSDLVLKPGPRVGKAAYELARLIHPEIFDE